MTASLVPLVVLLPLIGAATSLVLGRYRRAQIAIGVDDLEQNEGPEIAERPEHTDAELETPLTSAATEGAHR